ncbi:rhomboid-related protein 3-like [Diachasma alloeum]|uniref:rhomboid-related protein 3-like n=1 Tax=Diachasma alloeum TaxID=454923 RepID=UPI0007380F83|nr:rhomboid-related protein 3-like [Diachasma alloeum]
MINGQNREEPTGIAVYDDDWIDRGDMQGVFGHYINRYVHTMVPSRPILSSQLSVTSLGDLPNEQYKEEYSCRPPAVAMIIMSIIEIILYVYDRELGGAANFLIYNPTRRYEAWRYVTYMFVHKGIIHLGGNLSIQIMLGIPLEMVHKWWRVLIIYFAGVIAGSLGTSVALPKFYLAGASGGVFALMTAHIATIIMNWKQVKFAALEFFVFGFITILYVISNFRNRYVLHKHDDIAYDAHMAGAAAGLLVGINVLCNLTVKKWEKVLWWVSSLSYTVLMSAAILWNIFGMKE